jgi:peroxiredoxin-like protein
MPHQFIIKAKWNGGLSGNGTLSAAGFENSISVPKELQGPGIGTNPEELLVGAASTCYLITLAAILERRNVSLVNLELESEGIVATEGGLKFTQIIHRPRITLSAGATDEVIQQVRVAAERAEKACMISRALQGNVELLVDPTILS